MQNTSKLCKVCGVRAKCINFCALTCQSCKAFFRRNAFKLTIYRCRFDDNCHINETTRKLCKKCRLKKCFAVGMKKEWILNEEEKQIRLSQIEENKKLKQNTRKMSPNQTTFTTGSIGDNTIDNEINEYIMKIDDNMIASDECDEIIHEIFDNELDESENSNLTSDQMSVVSRESSTPSNCSTITIDETLSHIKTYDKLKNNCMAIEILNCNSMDKLNNLCSFNPFECKLIAELFDQRLLAIHPVSDRRAGRFTTVDELMVYIATNFESYLQSFVDKSKGLRAFTTQCLNDQIAMVKYCCIESQLLKSVVFYSPHLEGWAFQKDNNTSVVLSLDLLKGFNTMDFYHNLRNYLSTFDVEFQRDYHIIELLMPIILFNPERPNIINKDMVELQHQLYLYLLQRYLRIRYGSEYERKYNKIIVILRDIQVMNELHKQNFRKVSPEVCGPLLMEILDIQTIHNSV